MILDFIYKKRTLIGGLLILIILVGTGLIIYSMNKNKQEIKTVDNQEITIDIEGAVKNPGVYKLKEGNIIQDAINAANGLNDNADNDLIAKDINRSEILKNNQKIFIPIKTQVTQQVAAAETSNKINLNTASLEQLDSLPGIGPVYAQRIIDYRKKKQFSSLEEVMEIQGIGEKTFDKMKDLITI